MIFMLFTGLLTFKVKLFLKTLWCSILNHLQSKVTSKNCHSCIFFSIYNPKEVRILTNFFPLQSFRLADDQKSFNAACSNTILHFCAAMMGFFILKCWVFFLLVTLQEKIPPVKYHLCWIYISYQSKTLKTINFCFSAIFSNLLLSKFFAIISRQK